jgi:hypothetical protein
MSADQGHREYKVMTLSDRWFSTGFAPEKLELALNFDAKEGWTLSGMATVNIPGAEGRTEPIWVFERPM